MFHIVNLNPNLFEEVWVGSRHRLTCLKVSSLQSCEYDDTHCLFYSAAERTIHGYCSLCFEIVQGSLSLNQG